MKIGTRVRSLGIAGLLVVAVTVVVAWVFVERAREPVRNLTDNIVPTLELLTQLNVEFGNTRRELLVHVLNHDEAAMRQVEEEFNHSEKLIRESLAQYNKTISDDTDQKNSDEFRRELDAYFVLAHQALDASKQQQKDQAMQQALGPGAAQAGKVFDALDRMGDYYTVLTQRSRDSVNAGFSALLTTLGVVFAVAALGLLITGEYITRAVAGPLLRLRDFVAEVGRSYEFTRRLGATDRDEVGETSRAFDSLLDTLQGSLRELSDIGGKVGAHAGEVATASTELSAASHKVSESTVSMAAAVEQVTVSVNHVADRAESTDEIARNAGQYASEGGTVIGETIERINQIASRVQDSSANIQSLVERTANIGSVVNTIKEIADQTNLLALNAAIEAARAGEQGRGFAVVADEVRKLAERTASSTAEINDTVSAIQREARQTVEAMQRAVVEVEEGVAHAGQASEAIQRIRRSTESVVGEVGQISSAMREQSTAGTSMAQEIEKVAQMSEQTSTAALRTSEASNDLHSLARDMQQVIARYRV
ncbi:methyl-accepting chemotaxis protein [Chitiniphilus shinanonensis]|uniref:Methyl-accepting chemotaxis protein n=1 Tax=Chitiniphilus shinanonensis TaxID=553088 RepID=A0ABQ6BRW8_9NEIS|nr:methyl-accepting chemotaxis protein [Chitiniphilus shinanonensis]GLS04363.1 methyl-accepting chemotaxis protein [Chitiniphilus shinanonensis]